MPEHYGMKGHNSLLKDHMMPPQKAKKPIDEHPPDKPKPIEKPPPSAELPPVVDSSQDEGQGSSSSESNGSQSTIDENLILLGLGALILCSIVMMK